MHGHMNAKLLYYNLSEDIPLCVNLIITLIRYIYKYKIY
jgi:hypothetical protein